CARKEGSNYFLNSLDVW
nr:immunoglobulin heavy chain junction region [Macaca mulatta]MOV53304.1 immunoglobulin heavy chain junction region [Macaca mulatta]MOV53491.1 immunoglobulin heavy chain junction region [Macaca mulatta]MOV53988.1 immunoglobulin heavy chain junction region [Macaca mulatta]MOV54316.1 immunoglobulin heavy chain junction region [Macaca mulatta]